MKRTTGAALLLSAAVCLFATTGCSSLLTVGKQVQHGTLLYASYHAGTYTLYEMDPQSFAVHDQVALYQGWGDAIYKDPQGKIWCPVYYQPDMTNFANKVVVFDPTTGKHAAVTVGSGPRFVFFSGKDTYVVCEEDGMNPTIYAIDSSLQASKLTTVQGGGLLSGAQFDGSDFYFSSLHLDKNLKAGGEYPMLVKVSLTGEATLQPIDTKPRGFNNLLLLNGTLYMGLDHPEGTISAFDPNTLHLKKTLSCYKDMVGDLLPLDDHTLAVSNYSKRMQQGAKVTLIDLAADRVIKEISSKYAISHLSYQNGTYFLPDNRATKLAILNENGNVMKTLDAPTQVTNFVTVN